MGSCRLVNQYVKIKYFFGLDRDRRYVLKIIFPLTLSTLSHLDIKKPHFNKVVRFDDLTTKLNDTIISPTLFLVELSGLEVMVVKYPITLEWLKKLD